MKRLRQSIKTENEQDMANMGQSTSIVYNALPRRGMNPPATQRRPINGAQISLNRPCQRRRSLYMRLRLSSCFLICFLFFFLLGTLSASAQAAPPDKISLTWMSIANWFIEVGDTRIVTDGYITRIPETAFSGPSFAYGEPSVPDAASIQGVIKALGSPKVDFILTGHSHFDHSFDVAVWSLLTGAHIIGARSTCLQAFAQGIPASQCTAVEGGEEIPLGPGITVRVVRWNHSGDVTTTDGRLLHSPLELIEPPPLGSKGLKPGILQDFPNGGGARAYLFTAETTTGPVSWFYSNTGNAVTFRDPVTIEPAFFADLSLPLDNLRIAEHATPAREHLQTALKEAGLDQMDLWLSFSDRPLAEAVHQVLKPKAHIPHHWDGLFKPFFDGVPYAYADFPMTAGVSELWQKQQVRFLPPQQYMDKYSLTTGGVEAVENQVVKQQLGFGGP